MSDFTGADRCGMFYCTIYIQLRVAAAQLCDQATAVAQPNRLTLQAVVAL